MAVDASIWIEAADPSDSFHQPSRAVLSVVVRAGVTIFIPVFAAVEVACALSRRRRDAAAGRRLTDGVMRLAPVVQVEVDAALRDGTQQFLRGADALYAATATVIDLTLVTWDGELVGRAGALTPTAWLDANR